MKQISKPLAAIVMVVLTGCSDPEPAPSPTQDVAAGDTDVAATDAAGDVAADVALDLPLDTAIDVAVDAAPDAADTSSGPDADTAADATFSCDTPNPTRVREELAIATLDGYALSAFVDRPAGPHCPLPTILIQTPYNKESAYKSFFGDERADRPLFASPDYNFVVVDWRGRFGSKDVPGDGTWSAQDGYTNVEWIAAQPWSDGQVGTWGVSALCVQQYRTATGPAPTPAHPEFNDGPPPSLKAIVPIMCPIRSDYSVVYPGGVIRHEWAAGLDVLGFGLRALYENQPRANNLWAAVGASVPSARVAVPALVVAGWFDLLPNHSLAAFGELVALTDPAVSAEHKLLIGPWIHFASGGATSAGAGRKLTAEELQYIDTDRRIDADSLAFFDHHLRGVANDVPAWEPVRYAQVGEAWASAAQWPPSQSSTQTFYATAAQDLVSAAPSDGSLDVPYDANDPSPTMGGATLSAYSCVSSDTPVQCTFNPDPTTILLHGPTSQAAVTARADQATFQTAPLTSPLRLLGQGRVFVDVATTLDDADVAVRVVDIDDNGDALLISSGIARLSSWEDPTIWAPVAPGTRTSVEVGINADFAYTLPMGHRLGVILSGSNWPLYGRNPGTGATFHEDDVAAATKDQYTWGFPSTTLDLQSPGTSGMLTFFVDGSTRFEVGVAP